MTKRFLLIAGIIGMLILNSVQFFLPFYVSVQALPPFDPAANDYQSLHEYFILYQVFQIPILGVFFPTIWVIELLLTRYPLHRIYRILFLLQGICIMGGVL